MADNMLKEHRLVSQILDTLNGRGGEFNLISELEGVEGTGGAAVTRAVAALRDLRSRAALRNNMGPGGSLYSSTVLPNFYERLGQVIALLPAAADALESKAGV